MTTRVCHVTNAHKRDDRRILLKECVSLSKAGYEVNLIVNDDLCDEVFNGVNIRSSGLKTKNRLQRIVCARRKTIKMAEAVDADIYHIHDPELLPFLLRMAKRGKKTIFDSHEDVPYQILTKQWIPHFLKKLVSLMYSFYERYVISRVSAVISVTPKIVERFREINKDAYLVTNYPILHDYNETDRSHFRSIGFAGGITPQYNHHLIINAISSIQQIKYVMAGQLSESYFKQLADLPGWKKVTYLGVIPSASVNTNVYSSITIGMCLQSEFQSERLGGTMGVTKLFEYWERGIPVICSDYPLWMDIISEYNCGLCINPSDEAAIREAIHFLFDNPGLLREMGRNARMAVEEKFNWATQEKALLQVYKGLFP